MVTEMMPDVRLVACGDSDGTKDAERFVVVSKTYAPVETGHSTWIIPSPVLTFMPGEI